MDKLSSINKPIYSMLQTNVEGFDSLAELAQSTD